MDASIQEAVRWAEISHLRPVFDRYFPKKGKILEGGCGIGQFVIYYRRRGYDIEGVDFSSATVERLRQSHPGLPVRVGDVTALPYPDGYFECYYSGGVVEHFEEGPFRALSEARRVLASHGKLIITVPFLNRLRRVKSVLGLWSRYRGSHSTVAVPRRNFLVEPPPFPHMQFSEYYFTEREFAELLRRAGFLILEGYPCDVEWGEVCQTLYRILRRPAVAKDGIEPSEGLSQSFYSTAEERSGSTGASTLRRLWKDLFVTENRGSLWRRDLLTNLSAWSGHMLLFVCQSSGRSAPRGQTCTPVPSGSFT